MLKSLSHSWLPAQHSSSEHSQPLLVAVSKAAQAGRCSRQCLTAPGQCCAVLSLPWTPAAPYRGSCSAISAQPDPGTAFRSFTRGCSSATHAGGSAGCLLGLSCFCPSPFLTGTSICTVTPRVGFLCHCSRELKVPQSRKDSHLVGLDGLSEPLPTQAVL